MVFVVALPIHRHTPQGRTLDCSIHTHARGRVNACCQAGRDREDAHLTHTCPHTHRGAHRGAHHGGPGSGDTWENPPADAKAAGGDSAEEQRREGKPGLPLAFLFLTFFLLCAFLCLQGCLGLSVFAVWLRTKIFIFLAK